MESIPPASIFVFIEKPPYGYIQQGILYESALVMQNMEQWVHAYEQKPNRKIKVYYEDDHTKVYQIINREGESELGSILLNIYNGKEKQRRLQ